MRRLLIRFTLYFPLFQNTANREPDSDRARFDRSSFSIVV
ncbi:hypothetical protein CKA32_004988 [Geitlerinema sp. FC II]|nr:hypothetical protein CKA32_004988 [Geitlerinema sp. FC II]